MTLCDYCNWRDEIFDEHGVIDYCVRREIYSDKMEFIKECDYFQRIKSFVERTQRRKV